MRPLFKYAEIGEYETIPDAWIVWCSCVFKEDWKECRNISLDYIMVRIPFLRWRDTKHRTESDDIMSRGGYRPGYKPFLIGWCRPCLSFHWERHCGVTESFERYVFWERVHAETVWLPRESR